MLATAVSLRPDSVRGLWTGRAGSRTSGHHQLYKNKTKPQRSSQSAGTASEQADAKNVIATTIAANNIIPDPSASRTPRKLLTGYATDRSLKPYFHAAGRGPDRRSCHAGGRQRPRSGQEARLQLCWKPGFRHGGPALRR